MLNGIEIKIAPKATKKLTTSAFYTKAYRKGLSKSDKMDLLKRIESKQQQPFHSITISKNDPEKLTNTHSISKLLEENRRNLAKYDLIDVFSIIIPQDKAFDETEGNPHYGRLKTDNTGNPIKYDLFQNYLQVTPEQVARSSRYYSEFIPSKHLMQENLTWSFAYYEKNVDKELYSTIHSKWMEFTPAEQGGPLFLKLLLDEVSTTGEATLKALSHILETYKIKSDCKGEDISKVVNIFKAIFNSMKELKHGSDLPDDPVSNLLRVFTTTSVNAFNKQFEALEDQRKAASIHTRLNPQYPESMRRSGAQVLINDMDSAKYILEYANAAYKDLTKDGKWDEVLQQAPSKSTFIANSGQSTMTETSDQPTHFCQPIGSQPPPAATAWRSGICFNCGKEGHLVKDCPEPKDPERIKCNRAKHPGGSKQRRIPYKWRPPEQGENGKRIVDGRPYTFDPDAGLNGRWIPDQTPENGLSNGGRTLNVPSATANMAQLEIPTQIIGAGSVASTAMTGPTAMYYDDKADPAVQRLQLMAILQHCNEKMESL